MIVNMLGASYQYANAPLRRVGQPMFGATAPSDVEKLLNETYGVSTQKETVDADFWTGLKSALNVGLDFANQFLDLKKAQADADTAAALARVQAEINAGKSVDKIRQEMSYTPFIIGGGVLVAGLIVTAIIMSSGRRRR